jgi:WD40 repeat protein
MLTGRPPFQAASRDETITQLKAKEPAPPRSINAAIPRDLETIALKCLQKDPARRYASAAAVADDLALYLAGKPIKARPVGHIQRAVRLVRRNPVTSSLVALLALSLIAGAAIGITLAIQANRYADDSKHHLYVAHMNLAQQYWDAGRAGPVLDILRRYIPKEGEEDIRGWEWHYQWSLCHRELRRFGEWKAGVQCVAVSPNGRLTAAASDDGLIQVFDTATGDLRARLTDHKGAVYALTYSPDGTILASGGVDRHIRLWDVSGLKFQVSGSKSEQRPQAAESTPLPSGASGERQDLGELNRAGEGQSNLKPETSNLKPTATLTRHSNDIRGLAFSPDGTQLVSSSEDGNAWLWDMKTYEPIRSIRTGPARAVAIHPDGQQIVSTTHNGMIQFWNSRTGVNTAAYTGHSRNIYGLAFGGRSQRIFSAGSDGVVRCLDLSSRNEIWSVKHSIGFYCLSLAADERTLAAGSADQTVRLYDAATGESKGVYRGHTDWVNGVAFLPDGSRLISASPDGTVRVWNELCAQEGRTPTGHEEHVHWVAFSPDGRLLATAGIDRIGLWDTATGLARSNSCGFLGHASAIDWAPGGGWLAAGARDHRVYWWNLSDPASVKVLVGHGGAVGGVCVSPDGSLVASTSTDGTIRIWDVVRRQVKHVLRARAGPVSTAVFGPKGQLLISSHDDGAVRVWRIADGELLKVRKGHGRYGRGVLVSPDGAWFASSGGDGAIRIWNMETGDELQTLNGHDGTVYSVAVSKDGTRIASGGNDRTVKLWDVRSGQELRTFQFGEQVRSVAFGPDGRQIAASGANGVVRIWEASGVKLPTRALSEGASASPATDREALGLVVALMEHGLSKEQVKERLARENNGLERGNAPDFPATISPRVRNLAISLLDRYAFDEFASREGHRLAESSHWVDAAAAFARAAKIAPDEIEYWHCVASCELLAGRHEEYLRLCREMIQRFKNDDRANVISRLLNTCLLSPGMPLDEIEPIVKRLDAQFSEASQSPWLESGRRAILAHVAYLRGDHKSAEQLLQNAPAENIDTIGWLYLKASVQAALRNSEARQTFAEAELFAGTTMHWRSRIGQELQRRQALEAIERGLGSAE